MKSGRIFHLAGVGLIFILLISLAACTKSPATTTTTPPSTTVSIPGGALVNSDSVVTAKINAINKQATGYPWSLDVLIQASYDVDSLPNPTKDSVGKVVTVKTDQDMTSFKVGDVVNCRVKYVGDVNTPGGVTLYMYNIALQINP